MAIPLKLISVLLGMWLAAVSVGGGAFAAEIYAATPFEVEQGVYTARFSPAGDRIAFATDAGIFILDTSDGRQLAELQGEASSVYWSVGWSPDGSIFMVKTRQQLRLWSAADYSTEIAAIPLDDQTLIWEVPVMPFSPDGTRLAVFRKDDTATVWQIEGTRQLATLIGHTGTLTDAQFSPDGGRVATASEDKSAIVWEAATGNAIARLDGHQKAVRRVRFSPDGAHILTVADDQTVRVWDAVSGGEIATLQHQAKVNSAAFDREGKRVVTAADDGVARVFDAANGAELLALSEDGSENVLSAAFSPDGTRIVTGSSDAHLRIWDAGTGKQTAKLDTGHRDGYDVAFGADGSRVMVTPRGRMGIIFSPQQRIDDRLPDGIAGVWAFGPPAEIEATEQDLHPFCSTGPYLVHADGLVEYLVGGEDELLQPRQFMRCKADLTCDVFEGATSSNTGKPVDKATFALIDGTGSLCMASDPGNCQSLRRCPRLEWDDAARASGHAEQWDNLFEAISH